MPHGWIVALLAVVARAQEIELSTVDTELLELCLSKKVAENPERARELIEQGANASVVDQYKYSGVMWTVVRHRPSVLDVLLEHGADTEAINTWGRNALFLAAWEGDIRPVRTLLAHGADPNSGAEHDGWTALHKAAEMGHLDIVRALIEASANVTTLTLGGINDKNHPNGILPIELALRGKHEAIVELLKEHGAQIPGTMLARGEGRGDAKDEV